MANESSENHRLCWRKRDKWGGKRTGIEEKEDSSITVMCETGAMGLMDGWIVESFCAHTIMMMNETWDFKKSTIARTFDKLKVSLKRSTNQTHWHYQRIYLKRSQSKSQLFMLLLKLFTTCWFTYPKKRKESYDLVWLLDKTCPVKHLAFFLLLFVALFHDANLSLY